MTLKKKILAFWSKSKYLLITRNLIIQLIPQFLIDIFLNLKIKINKVLLTLMRSQII